VFQNPRMPSAATADPERLHSVQAFRAFWSGRLHLLRSDPRWPEFVQDVESMSGEWLVLARHLAREHTGGGVASANFSRRPPAPPRQNPGQWDAVEASRVQRLYRSNRGRAVRSVLQPNQVGFSGDPEACRLHWMQEAAARPLDRARLDAAIRTAFPPRPTGDANLCSPITAAEVGRRLRNASNTAPGADRLEYRHLRLVDPACDIIAPLLSVCLHFQDVPPSWKAGHTVLIYKKGDPAVPGNFRPITLLPTLYKLLSGCLASRLTAFLQRHSILSPQQKGFLPGCEGCLEQSFVVESVFAEAKLRSKGLCTVFLDLQNAFGSVPHAALLTALRAAGAGESFCFLVANVYRGSAVTLRLAGGPLEPFPLLSGVRQGDPLSPILFDVVMEPLIRAVLAVAPGLEFSVGETPVSICALADDLAIFAAQPEGMRRLLNAVGTAADSVGLRFRPEKCRASVKRPRSYRGPDEVFSLAGEPIPQLAATETVQYLGAPQGLAQPRAAVREAATSLERDIHLLSSSLLAPWQKLDALKAFLLPRLSYLCRARKVEKGLLKPIDQAIRNFCRAACYVPMRASTAWLYAPRAYGGLGLTELATDATILRLTQACRMFSSPDPTVRGIARTGLRRAVELFGGSSSLEDASVFLSNGSFEGDRRHRGDGSLWFQARRAARSLELGVTLQGELGLRVIWQESDSSPGSTTVGQMVTDLRTRACKAHLATWHGQRDQGKVARCLATDFMATHSHFLLSGYGISFRSWRFIHRARLDLIPCRAVRRRWDRSAPRDCRRCGLQEETLPHVLNHCPQLFVAMRKRHDAILDRLIAGLPPAFRESCRRDRYHPLDREKLGRPDLIVEDSHRVVIVDVAVPFDNDEEALVVAQQRKEEKYAELARRLGAALGKEAQCLALVVGSLGTWHPANEATLNALGIARGYRKLLRQLCVCDVVNLSCSIWSDFSAGRMAHPSSRGTVEQQAVSAGEVPVSQRRGAHRTNNRGGPAGLGQLVASGRAACARVTPPPANGGPPLAPVVELGAR